MKIYTDRSKHLINAKTYCDDVLKKFKRRKCFLIVSHSINTVRKSIVDEHKWMNRVQFASEIEFIMYAIKCTKPYVSYKLIVNSKYHSDPGEVH